MIDPHDPVNRPERTFRVTNELSDEFFVYVGAIDHDQALAMGVADLGGVVIASRVSVVEITPVYLAEQNDVLHALIDAMRVELRDALDRIESLEGDAHGPH